VLVSRGFRQTIFHVTIPLRAPKLSSNFASPWNLALGLNFIPYDASHFVVFFLFGYHSSMFHPSRRSSAMFAPRQRGFVSLPLPLSGDIFVATDRLFAFFLTAPLSSLLFCKQGPAAVHTAPRRLGDILEADQNSFKLVAISSVTDAPRSKRGLTIARY
jgi:hypothetical protein